VWWKKGNKNWINKFRFRAATNILKRGNKKICLNKYINKKQNEKGFSFFAKIRLNFFQVG
jgi:hypothetical protein